MAFINRPNVHFSAKYGLLLNAEVNTKIVSIDKSNAHIQ